MSLGLEYMDRQSHQQERLRDQRKRINTQNLRSGGETERKEIENARIAAQTDRILKQREMDRERAVNARMRGEAVTGVDELEREKLSKQSCWSMKWDRRRNKWDARARKFDRR